jgi:predicted RNase H-like nuclease (RuvC/YqgF family)
VEKLKREAARLQVEVERLQAEVGRQKSLRETERTEFADSKERMKASWAADREDFARVKQALKKKNAEHHIQSGRLSQVRSAPHCGAHSIYLFAWFCYVCIAQNCFYSPSLAL